MIPAPVRMGFLLLTTAFLGGMMGAVTVGFLQTSPSREERIHEFYAVENAVLVSPHSLRKKIAQGDTSFTLVDLRSREEYEREHIVGAVSIPAYADPDTDAYDEVDRIVAAFRALPQDTPIIVYCYSMPCMTGRKVGLMLAEHGIFVQHLGIGWNEWRHFWQLWNHEHEWDTTRVTDYIASGPEPGTYSGPFDLNPCTEGRFGC